MLTAAVIGVGTMGRHHLRVYRDLEGVQLVAAADAREEVASAEAGRHGARAYGDYRELLRQERPDLVSVVVPTSEHCRVVVEALSAGCHVLVEKPIASSVPEAEEMIRTARRADRLLMVGHIERFNPVILELKRRLEAGELGRIFQILTRRLGPFPARIRDVGVIVDLATHDLDVMRYLTGAEAVRAHVETDREFHSCNEDLFAGLVRFDNNVLGVLEVNWLTPAKIREIYVTGERGMFLANYVTQELFFYENADARRATWDDPSGFRSVSEGTMTRFPVPKGEPLRIELESFVAAVRDGQRARFASSEDGLAALRLALAMVQAGQTQRTVHLEPLPQPLVAEPGSD